MTFSIRLDTDENPAFCVSLIIIIIFFGEVRHKWDHALFSRSCALVSGSCALFTGPTNLFFTKIFIKNGSHCTIHTFKNYFVTIFSAINFQFSTISSIQTDLKLVVIITSFEKKMIINLILVFPLKVEINRSHF